MIRDFSYEQAQLHKNDNYLITITAQNVRDTETIVSYCCVYT